MIKYNVGVSVERVIEIKRIDSDYFEEDTIWFFVYKLKKIQRHQQKMEGFQQGLQGMIEV
jgi:phosphoribosyl-AMP cyclohydrolase